MEQKSAPALEFWDFWDGSGWEIPHPRFFLCIVFFFFPFLSQNLLREFCRIVRAVKKWDLGIGKVGFEPGFWREILKKSGGESRDGLGFGKSKNIPKKSQKFPKQSTKNPQNSQKNQKNSSQIVGKASQNSCWEKGGGSRSFSRISPHFFPLLGDFPRETWRKSE